MPLKEIGNVLSVHLFVFL